MATSFLDPVLNPVLQPLLDIGPIWGILALALFISLVVTIVYKYATDQKKMKDLKMQQKDFQKKMKELRSQPDKMMAMQKDAMKVNMEYMKMSFRPTLITMIPIILLFGWMAAHLAYEPIFPNETYSVTAMFKEGVVGDAELIPSKGTELTSNAKQEIKSNQATWNLKSSSGEHFLKVQVGKDVQSKKVLITKSFEYEEAVANFDHSDIKSIKINYNVLKPLGEFSLFGWKPGWLGLYIILSIVFSMVLRKAFKLY